jgi:hypothetical protein
MRHTTLIVLAFVFAQAAVQPSAQAASHCGGIYDRLLAVLGVVRTVTFEPLPDTYPAEGRDGLWSVRAEMARDSIMKVESEPAKIAAVIVKEGGASHLLYEPHGDPLTQALRSLENGIYNYVIRRDGTIVVGSEFSEGMKFPHPCLVGGRADGIQVKGAGRLKVIDGRVVAIDMASGHFKPPPEFAPQTERFFNALPESMRTGTLRVTPLVTW